MRRWKYSIMSNLSGQVWGLAKLWRKATEIDDSSVIFGNGVDALIQSDYRRNNDPRIFYQFIGAIKELAIHHWREVSSLFLDSFTTSFSFGGGSIPLSTKLTCRVVKWGVLSRKRHLDLNPINFEFLGSFNQLRSMRRRCSPPLLSTIVQSYDSLILSISSRKARSQRETRVFFSHPKY